MQVNISVTGVAFRAMETSLLDMQKRTTESKSVEIVEKQSADNKTTIIFRDPITAELVSSSLSAENMRLLKEHFGQTDFSEKGDSIILDGRAERFVSGWYGDIAYNRGFLEADSDGDGLLSKTEYTNTKNSFDVKKIADIDTNKGSLQISNEISSNYISSFDAGDEQPHNISDELNSTISIDKNLDGSLELKEILGKIGGGSAESFVLNEFKLAASKSQMAKTSLNKIGFFNDTIVNYSINKFLSKKKTAKNDDGNDEQPDIQSIIKKLIASNGNDSVLSVEEKRVMERAIGAIKAQVRQQLEKEQLIDIKA